MAPAEEDPHDRPLATPERTPDRQMMTEGVVGVAQRGEQLPDEHGTAR
jgi:hypothetical protein